MKKKGRKPDKSSRGETKSKPSPEIALIIWRSSSKRIKTKKKIQDLNRSDNRWGPSGLAQLKNLQQTKTIETD